MVRLGMTPTEALRAAPVVAVGILDRKAPGALHVVGVDGDPTCGVAALRRVGFVMKGGAVYRNQQRFPGAAIQRTTVRISVPALRFSTIADADILRDDDGVTNSA